MTISLPVASRQAMCDALVDRLDLGAGAGTIQIRSGTRPAPDAAATGTLLATVTLPDPAFGSANSSGVAALADPAQVTAVATGVASWFRALNSDGASVMDGKVTETGGGGDLTLATTSLTSGLAVDITGGSVTQPAGTVD